MPITHPAAGSMPLSARQCDIDAFISEVKAVPGLSFHQMTFAEVGHLDGRFVRSFAKAFPALKGAMGIDCCLEGYNGATYGDFMVGNVPVSLIHRNALNVACCNVNVLLISSATMNDEAQIVMAKLASCSTDLRYLMWFHGDTLGETRNPRVATHLTIGGFLHRTHHDKLMIPAAKGKIVYDCTSYNLYLYDMDAHDNRRKLKSSFDAMLAASAGYLNADCSMSDYTTTALNGDYVWVPLEEPRRGMNRTMCKKVKQSTWGEALWRFWDPSGPLLTQTTLNAWLPSRREVENAKVAARTWRAKTEELQRTLNCMRQTSQTSPATMTDRGCDIAPSATPASTNIARETRNDECDCCTNTCLDALIAGNVRRARKCAAEWGVKSKALLKARKWWRAMLAWSQTSESDANAVIDLICKLVTARGAKRALSLDRRGAAALSGVPSDARTVGTIAKHCHNAIMELSKCEDRKSAMRTLASMPINAIDEDKLRIVDGEAVPADERQWTATTTSQREYQKWLKCTAFSASSIANTLDVLNLPLSACDAFYAVSRATGADVVASSSSVRNFRRKIEAIEDTYGLKLYDSVLDARQTRGKGQEAWNFDLISMVKDDYVKFGGNRDTFEIKATGDKADLHKNLGLFIYGYSLCDKHVQIDHQGADAQRVVGMFLTNGEGMSKKGDALIDQMMWGRRFYDDAKRLRRDGITVDGRRIKIVIRWGGDWRYLAELIGMEKESYMATDALCCGQCPCQKHEWAHLNEDGTPVKCARTRLQLLPQYNADLSHLEAKSGKIRFLERCKLSECKLRQMKKGDLVQMSVQLTEDYAPSVDLLKTFFGGETSIDPKWTKKRVLESVLRFVTYYDFHAYDLYTSELTEDGRSELSDSRLRDILRLRQRTAELDSKSHDELMLEAKIFLNERKKLRTAYLRVEMLTTRRSAMAVTYDDTTICVAHCNCRIRCSLIDRILADGVDKLGADRINELFSAILSKNELQRANFHVTLGKNGAHVRAQPLIWQDAKCIMLNLSDCVEQIYDGERAVRVMRLAKLMEDWCTLIEKKDEFDEGDYEIERQLVDEWGALGIKLFGDKFVRVYVHKAISGHIGEEMRETGNLYRYSNQGWEAKIRDVKAYYYRCTQKGGHKLNSHDSGEHRDQDGNDYAVDGATLHKHAFILLPIMRREQRLNCIRSGRFEEHDQDGARFVDAHNNEIFSSTPEFIEDLSRKRGVKRNNVDTFKLIYKKRKQ